MNRFLGAVLTLVLCFGPISSSYAEDKDAQAVIDRAVKVMGGAEKLAKAEIVTYKARLKPAGSGDSREISTQITEAGAGRIRAELEREGGNGEIIKTLTVMNGDKVWRKQGEMIRELDQEAVVLMKRNREMFDAVRRPVILKDPRFLVKMAGEQKIGDKTAVVLEVTGTHGQDFKLSFDKENGLPIRLEATSTLPGGREAAMTTLFTGYKEFDGIQVATRRLQASNSVKTSESELTEFQILDKVAQGTFDEPK
jgi:hypothetical protein